MGSQRHALEGKLEEKARILLPWSAFIATSYPHLCHVGGIRMPAAYELKQNNYVFDLRSSIIRVHMQLCDVPDDTNAREYGAMDVGQ